MSDLNQAKDCIRRLAVQWEGIIAVANALDQIESIEGHIASLIRERDRLEKDILSKRDECDSIQKRTNDSYAAHDAALNKMQEDRHVLYLETEAKASTIIAAANAQADQILNDARNSLQDKLNELNDKIQRAVNFLGELEKRTEYAQDAACDAECDLAEVKAELDQVNAQIEKLASRAKE